MSQALGQSTRFALTGAGITCGYSNGLPVTDDIEEEAEAVIAMQ